MPNEFTFADLKNHLSDLTDQQIRSQLYKLRDDNVVKSEGKARAVKWSKLS